MKRLLLLGLSAAAVVSVRAEMVNATGGVVTALPGYLVHTFTNSGTFTVDRPVTVDLLIVGGGGGGGGGAGGGGGGGQVQIIPGVALAAGEHPVSVGAGGAGTAFSSSACGSNGGDSSFDDYVSGGGGGGMGMYLTKKNQPEAVIPGGASADAGNDKGYTVKEARTSSLFPEIHGGSSYSPKTSYTADTLGGGGAGAGGSGVDARVLVTNWVGEVGASDYTITTNWVGNGGPGVVCDYSGTAVAYGGGGGGGGAKHRGLGVDGGGDGRSVNTTPTANTVPPVVVANRGGGGGGGCNWSQSYGAGADGGSGIVIVRYAIEYNDSFDAVEGGEVTLDGDYEVHTFRESGELTLSGESYLDYLIVGGGGGGGSCHLGGGGGGAGGVIYRTGITKISGTYPIVVGLGGAGGAASVNDPNTSSNGSKGGDSSAFGETAIGGGYGAGKWGTNTPGSGGSGGGACFEYWTTKWRYVAGGEGTSGQGYDGGASSNYWHSSGTGGGGGGAGGPGTIGLDQNSWQTGRGGPGVTNSITGRPVVYAAGGAGGAKSGVQYDSHYTRGGLTGGGHGTSATWVPVDVDGYPGTGSGGGGGGGGAWNNKSCSRGGNGADGVVIVRVRRPRTHSWAETSDSASGGVRKRVRTAYGSYYVHTFTNDGSFVTGDDVLADVLIVGGGGGGGSGGGGGGGAQVQVISNVVIAAGTYPVTIGQGGAGGFPTGSIEDRTGLAGTPSTFLGYAAYGGGGGIGLNTGTTRLGFNGGGGGCMQIAGTSRVERVTWNLGNRGACGYHLGGNGNDSIGGGGGGAGGPGGDGYQYCSEAHTAHGGVGVACDFSGVAAYYGGGGGGGVSYWDSADRSGGLGGGGSGGRYASPDGTPGGNGTPGTGGGGGGSGYNVGNGNVGGNGGSGIVIIRYRPKRFGTVLFVR